MSFKIKPQSAATERAEPKLPTFQPRWIMPGETVPKDGAPALMLPVEMLAAYQRGAILRSKDGTGASASACYLGTPEKLTIPRVNGGEVDVTVKINAYAAAKDAQGEATPTDPAERLLILRAELEALEEKAGL